MLLVMLHFKMLFGQRKVCALLTGGSGTAWRNTSGRLYTDWLGLHIPAYFKGWLVYDCTI